MVKIRAHDTHKVVNRKKTMEQRLDLRVTFAFVDCGRSDLVTVFVASVYREVNTRSCCCHAPTNRDFSVWWGTIKG